MRDMNVTVTGASGHLGINLISDLIDSGYKVRALVHENCRPLKDLPVELVFADILDKVTLLRAFTGTDIVFHLAARVSITKSDAKAVEDINISGTRNVIDACRQCQIDRLVHVSSIHAYNQHPLDRELTESRDLVAFSKNNNPYDRSKAEGERLVLNAIDEGLNAVIVNPTGIIGPNDYQPSHIGASLLSIARGQMPVTVNAGFDWVDVRDVSRAMITAAKQAPCGSRYLISGHWATINEIHDLVSKYVNNCRRKLTLPLWIARIGAPLAMLYYHFSGQRPLFTPIAMQALTGNQQISHQKASFELNYRPREFETTIQDTMSWFRVNGYLEV